MKRKFLLLVAVLLVSCNNLSYAEETISKPDVSDKLVDFSETEKKAVKGEATKVTTIEDNSVVSPVSLELIDSYTADVSTFSTLYKKLNVKADNFELSDKFSVASTETIANKDVSYVSYFEGDTDKLSNSLSRYYDRDIKIANPGTYYFSLLDLKDRFLVPHETKKDMPFNQEGKHEFVEFIGDYSTVQDEKYTLVSFLINKTELRLIMPTDSHSLSEVSLSDFYAESSETKRVHAYVPEFEKEYQYVKQDDTVFHYQGNKFSFDKYGVTASSFTVKGPTSVDPAYDLDITFDRPFLFASFYDDVMLFYGSVSLL